MVSFGFLHNSKACDDASFTFNSEIDNGDGTFTYDLDLCAEFNGLEGNPDWFNMIFSGGTFTNIDSYTPTPAVPTTTTSDFYPPALMSGDTEIRWTTGSTLTAHGNNNLCVNVIVVTNGKPAQIGGSYHDTYGGVCNYSYALPLPCSIDNVVIANQTACDISNNTYTQEVTVTYSSPPSTGTLDVNGQSFAIGSSPQTVTLIGLIADGNVVNGTVEFSDDLGCSGVVSFTAPASCVPCSIDNVALGSQSACNSSNNTYSQEVIVTYSNPPATGTLDVNGQSFPIGTSPQTVSLTGLIADGNVVNGTLEFSDDATCNDVVSFTAPASCAVICNPDNGIWD